MYAVIPLFTLFMKYVLSVKAGTVGGVMSTNVVLFLAWNARIVAKQIAGYLRNIRLD